MKSLKKPADTLETFLARVEDYNGRLVKLQDNVGELRLVQAKVLSEPSVSERQKHLTKQQNLVRENKDIGATMHKQIKDEKVKTEKAAKSQDRQSEVTIRKTQMEACMKRFLNIWTEYNNVQLEFRDSNKKALIRQLKIIDPTSNVSNEEIEEKLENGDLTVLSSIIKESDQAKEDLKRLEGRHLEMIKLERGIVEVNDMFLDLAHLVEEQGETVGRIEDRVGEAAAHVEQGADQLRQAEKKKKSARRLKFLLAGLLAGVALVVLIILLTL